MFWPKCQSQGKHKPLEAYKIHTCWNFKCQHGAKVLQITPIIWVHFNVLIDKIRTCFGTHWLLCKRSPVQTVISNTRNCGEIINVWFTEANMCTAFLMYVYVPCIFIIVCITANKRTYLFIHSYMFRNCCVIVREFYICALPSYITS
jgi:hypothetical protein